MPIKIFDTSFGIHYNYTGISDGKIVIEAVNLSKKKKIKCRHKFSLMFFFHLFFLRNVAKDICDKEIKDMQIEIVEVGDLPLLNPDIKPFPPSVDAFLEQVRAADCFLFATAEYNYSVTGTVALYTFIR